MAGKVLETTVKQSSGGQGLDKTDKTWVENEEDKTIIIGNSTKDLIRQKGETFEYIEKSIFIKIEFRKEKEIEKGTFIEYKLKNGKSILLNTKKSK